MTRWLLIDVSNWAYKLLHTGGGPVGAVALFRRWLDLAVDKTEPERVVLAMDSERGQSFRRQLNPHYKAGRKEPPPGLGELIESIKQLAVDNCHDIAAAEGFEADDVIATVTRIGLESHRQVVICSSDKDLRQLLVRGRVMIFRSVPIPKNGTRAVFRSRTTAVISAHSSSLVATLPMTAWSIGTHARANSANDGGVSVFAGSLTIVVHPCGRVTIDLRSIMAFTPTASHH
jgi:hypothetical protein